MDKYPKYVWFNKTVLRRRSTSDGYFLDYYCYNGDWGIDVYITRNTYTGENILKSKRDNNFNLNHDLVSATEQEWLNQVGSYLPESLILENGMTGKEYLKSIDPSFYFSNGKYWGTNPCCEIALSMDENLDTNKYMYLLIR